jgi:Uma2 family endonuclease
MRATIEIPNDTMYRTKAWTWTELANDPLFSRLPMKLELDKFGRVVMISAANWQHSVMEGKLVEFLNRQLGIRAVPELAVATHEGTFEPDVVWAPESFWAALDPQRSDLPNAPPLIAEVLSPSNTAAEMQMKIAAYLQAGAGEVWLVTVAGAVRVFNEAGQQDTSDLVRQTAAQISSALKN